MQQYDRDDLCADEQRDGARRGEAYFKFVPETEGDYTIYSYDNGDLDPVGTLYDSSLNEIDASEASPKARPTMSESAATRPSSGRPTTRPGARPER